MAATADLECNRGEDILVTASPRVLTDITGWTISFRVKRSFNEAVLMLTVNAVLSNPTQGIFTVGLSAAQTQSFASGKYVYDVWRTDTGSNAELLIGNLTIRGSVRIP